MAIILEHVPGIAHGTQFGARRLGPKPADECAPIARGSTAGCAALFGVGGGSLPPTDGRALVHLGDLAPATWQAPPLWRPTPRPD